MAEACTRPPEGWWCSLEEGHDGPCPTHPYYGTPIEVILAPYMSPEQIAHVRAQLEASITPEMAAKQEAAFKRIRERNARLRREPNEPTTEFGELVTYQQMTEPTVSEHTEGTTT